MNQPLIVLLLDLFPEPLTDPEGVAQRVVLVLDGIGDDLADRAAEFEAVAAATTSYHDTLTARGPV
ncbi:MAG TPA: hypothetical protein VKX96_15995, partial [Chloroflexota bacterium]|nr:hypothetical protein [Chloroflexota bacterium]